MADIRLYLLGELRVEYKSESVQLPTQQTRLLLAYLALEPGKRWARKNLAVLFWGKGDLKGDAWRELRRAADQESETEADETSVDKSVLTSLRTALYTLRKQLGRELVGGNAQFIEMDAASLWVDALEFKRQAEEFLNAPTVEPGAHALELYRGDLLKGYDDDPDFPWLEPKRTLYRNLYRDVLLRLAQHARTQGKYTQATAYAQKVLDVDPDNELAYQHLMLCEFRLGHRALALELYSQLLAARRDSPEAESLEPSPETQNLYHLIRRATSTTTSAAALTNLPQPLTHFVGRTREADELVRRLTPGTDRSEGKISALPNRLVTLTGPGGCGKTRLAIQVAKQLLPNYPDGVWWVELEGLDRESGLVPQAVAQVLAVREQSTLDPIETLISVVREKKLLLVLDNCEHVIEPCAALCARLLVNCPHLGILTTSREVLRVPGEFDYGVMPFDLPAGPELPALEKLDGYDAVHFFVERTRFVRPEFALTDQNAEEVVRICRCLDGIPLALELAAARMKTLSTNYIAIHLDKLFELLVRGPRSPERHQTLQKAIDWSYDLLTPAEQQTLQQLGVFVSRFSLEATEAVCADSEPEMLSERLASLVDKSLVLLEILAEDMPRYRLLDTIRLYARDKLEQNPERTQKVLERMAGYYLHFAQQHAREYDLLESEWQNISAGMHQAYRLKHAEQVMAYGQALTDAWFRRGHFTDARQAYPWVWEAARELEEQEIYFSAVLNCARVCIELGNYEEAKQLVELARQGFREVNDQHGLATVFHYLGWIDYHENDFEGANQRFEESLALKAQLGDETGVGEILYRQSQMLYYLDDYAAALETGKRALAIHERTDDLRGRIVTLRHLSWVADAQQDTRAANEYALQALALCEQLDDLPELGVTLTQLSYLAVQRGEVDTARAYAEKSSGLLRDTGDRKSYAQALHQLGRVEMKAGRLHDALAALSKSLKLVTELNDSIGAVYVSTLLGSVYQALGQLDEACATWTQALRLAQDRNLSSMQQALEEQLRTCYSAE